MRCIAYKIIKKITSSMHFCWLSMLISFHFLIGCPQRLLETSPPYCSFWSYWKWWSNSEVIYNSIAFLFLVSTIHQDYGFWNIIFLFIWGEPRKGLMLDDCMRSWFNSLVFFLFCSNRELSMILDALLKTRSRMVLMDIIEKNGRVSSLCIAYKPIFTEEFILLHL